MVQILEKSGGKPAFRTARCFLDWFSGKSNIEQLEIIPQKLIIDSREGGLAPDPFICIGELRYGDEDRLAAL